MGNVQFFAQPHEPREVKSRRSDGFKFSNSSKINVGKWVNWDCRWAKALHSSQVIYGGSDETSSLLNASVRGATKVASTPVVHSPSYIAGKVIVFSEYGVEQGDRFCYKLFEGCGLLPVSKTPS